MRIQKEKTKGEIHKEKTNEDIERRNQRRKPKENTKG